VADWDGVVHTWGKNDVFQLGYNNAQNSNVPGIPGGLCEIEVIITEVEELSADITIYPNPTSDLITWTGFMQSRFPVVRIYDAQGREVFPPMLSNGADMTEMPGGLYLIKFMGGKEMKVSRFMKQ
jgi:Secretion system C-terminal sorting domain/Regulator of chromosome condensation (RCC1) repeat